MTQLYRKNSFPSSCGVDAAYQSGNQSAPSVGCWLCSSVKQSNEGKTGGLGRRG